MKFIFSLFFTFFLIFFISIAFAGEIKINRTVKNGGCNGYKNVSSQWSSSGRRCTIKCSEPGEEPCPYTCLTQESHYGLLIEQAEQMILSGTLNGTIYNTDTNAYVTWIACLNENGTYDTEFIVIQN